MKPVNLFYNEFLNELEKIVLIAEEAMQREDCEIVAEVLAEVASEVALERLEELFDTIKMKFTAAREDLQ